MNNLKNDKENEVFDKELLDKLELTEEEKEKAKQMVDQIMKELDNDPAFKHTERCYFCFVTSCICFFLMITASIILGILNWESALYAFLTACLLLFYDVLSFYAEESYFKFYLNTNHILHLLVLGIFILLINAKYPEILLGFNIDQLVKILIPMPVLLLLSFQLIDGVIMKLFTQLIAQERKD